MSDENDSMNIENINDNFDEKSLDSSDTSNSLIINPCEISKTLKD